MHNRYSRSKFNQNTSLNSVCCLAFRREPVDPGLVLKVCRRSPKDTKVETKSEHELGCVFLGEISRPYLQKAKAQRTSSAHEHHAREQSTGAQLQWC